VLYAGRLQPLIDPFKTKVTGLEDLFLRMILRRSERASFGALTAPDATVFAENNDPVIAFGNGFNRARRHTRRASAVPAVHGNEIHDQTAINLHRAHLDDLHPPWPLRQLVLLLAGRFARETADTQIYVCHQLYSHVLVPHHLGYLAQDPPEIGSA
jgi:hypothetical protein